MTDDDKPFERAQRAYDGELDAQNFAAFERDRARDPELAAAQADLAALGAALRAHAPREAASAALRARLEAMSAPAPRRFWLGGRRPGLREATAAAIGAAAALAAVSLWRPPDPTTLATLAAGYQRAALSGQPYDVASSDRHTVKPWLTARAPLGVVAPDLADAGFTLAGGRLDIVDRRPAPTLVYRIREHLIAVTELPLDAGIGEGATSTDGYHVERWRDAERAYVAMSDLDAGDLAAFAAKFRERARP